MFTMCNAALKARWDTATARRHWTEQWQHDQAGRRPLPNRTEFINFSGRDLISDDSSFYAHILSAIDLQCHVFSFWKVFVKCPSLSVNGIFDDVRYDVTYNVISTSRCGSFGLSFLILVHWGIKIIRGKNYETVSKFAKVIARIPWLLFLRTRCIS